MSSQRIIASSCAYFSIIKGERNTCDHPNLGNDAESQQGHLSSITGWSIHAYLTTWGRGDIIVFSSNYKKSQQDRYDEENRSTHRLVQASAYIFMEQPMNGHGLCARTILQNIRQIHSQL